MNNTGIKTNYIFSLSHKVAPPRIFDILLQLNPQWSIIKESCKSVVDFTRWEDDPATFAKADNFIHVRKLGCLRGHVLISWFRFRTLNGGHRSGNPPGRATKGQRGCALKGPRTLPQQQHEQHGGVLHVE